MAPSPDSPRFLRQEPDFAEERAAIQEGLWPVAGLDEAGRGPLAGSVVAAAVILDPKRILFGLNDSKRLSAPKRESLFDQILGSALAVAFSAVCAEGIDGSNIRVASLEAMRRALNGLSVQPSLALIDGRDVPPGLPCGAKALIGGDGRSQSIAAASIVAKVVRDRIMAGCGRQDARYGFESHVGYGTLQHRQAITAHGALPRLHRMSFAPLKPAAPQS